MADRNGPRAKFSCWAKRWTRRQPVCCAGHATRLRASGRNLAFVRSGPGCGLGQSGSWAWWGNCQMQKWHGAPAIPNSIFLAREQARSPRSRERGPVEAPCLPPCLGQSQTVPSRLRVSLESLGRWSDSGLCLASKLHFCNRLQMPEEVGTSENKTGGLCDHSKNHGLSLPC